MSLKLRELWNECEKLEKDAFNTFVEGLLEIHDKKWMNKEPAKPCVAQEKRTVCNRGRWDPQEDDLLHKCVTSNVNLYQGFVAFSKDPANKKGRSIEAAKQRYFRLESEGRW